MGAAALQPPELDHLFSYTTDIDQFRAHTKIVISTPMRNFGLPYRLEHKPCPRARS
jgi:FMN-dependent NADH-azoreductase